MVILSVSVDSETCDTYHIYHVNENQDYKITW